MQVTVLEQNKAELEQRIQFHKDRLAAIHEGKYSVNQSGNIVFKEGRLNG